MKNDEITQKAMVVHAQGSRCVLVFPPQSKAKVAAPKDADSRQKSFEHHLHGREVLPQMQKHEPKTKPESRDDLLGEALAAEEKQHKIEHHQHVKEARHHAVAHVH